MHGVEKFNNIIIPDEMIENKIILIRGQKVMLDKDLADLYNVDTSMLKRAVRRNLLRFPDDFMFELTKEEQVSLRCHFGTLKRGRHPKYLHYAFTEQGIAMLSSVLKSKRAILVNISIMRAFVKLRRLVTDHKELSDKLKELELKFVRHDDDIITIFRAIRQIIKDEEKPPGKFGFI